LPSDPEATAPVVTAAKTSSTGNGISLLQSLLSSINSKAAPRRALFSLPLEIGPGLKVGVKGYTLIKRQEVVKSCYVWVGGEQIQIATGVTSHIAEDTARTVEKAEIRKAFSFGGEQVIFTEEESRALRNFGDPVIRIIGFKPMELLPEWANYKCPVFIYPDEVDFVGSTRVFSALHRKLLSSQKFAVVWFIARRNATPNLAAMIPGDEKTDESGEQTEPPGLWIIPLPYADDIRQNPEAPMVRAPDSLVHFMRDAITQLNLPRGVYDPKKYPNPCKSSPTVFFDVLSNAFTLEKPSSGSTAYSRLSLWTMKYQTQTNKTTKPCHVTNKSTKYVFCTPILPLKSLICSLQF
jgi:ATP-dependent DNA helicase 2 subunit 1